MTPWWSVLIEIYFILLQKFTKNSVLMRTILTSSVTFFFFKQKTFSSRFISRQIEHCHTVHIISFLKQWLLGYASTFTSTVQDGKSWLFEDESGCQSFLFITAAHVKFRWWFVGLSKKKPNKKANEIAEIPEGIIYHGAMNELLCSCTGNNVIILFIIHLCIASSLFFLFSCCLTILQSFQDKCCN